MILSAYVRAPLKGDHVWHGKESFVFYRVQRRCWGKPRRVTLCRVVINRQMVEDIEEQYSMSIDEAVEQLKDLS